MKKPESPSAVIGNAIYSVIKPLHKEGEKLRRNANRTRQERYLYAPPRTTQKDIVFAVLPRAVENARGGGDGLVGVRDLYYSVRPLCYAHCEWDKGTKLDYGYFSQTLLTEYQEIYGPIVGLWYDPRGRLCEPHTGRALDIGTREVGTYEFPLHVFDKILYVEKEGVAAQLLEAQLDKRYDMAVVSGKGYATTAGRDLLRKAERGRNYQLFVFHDADIDGYNIARTLREATRRMPYHRMEVLDVGLTIEDAVEMDLDPEPFARKQDVPTELYYRLTDLELEYFSERRERFELNAILPVSRRIEYIERKLEESDVRGKVIPPEDKLSELAKEVYREEHARWVDEALQELISLDEIKKTLADKFLDKFELKRAKHYIEKGFEQEATLSWRAALKNELSAIQEGHAHALKGDLWQRITEKVKGSG